MPRMAVKQYSPRAANSCPISDGSSPATARDGIGNQGEDAQRRKPNHQLDDLDDDGIEALEEVEERLRLFSSAP